MPFDIAAPVFASFFAGLVDAIVGGGGLILVPALFASFPAAPPATLLGTNKCASIWGTAIAAAQYGRRVELRWRVLLPAALLALCGSWLGAWALLSFDPTTLRKLLPLVLAAVLLYTLANKHLGSVHALRHSGGRELAITGAVGLGVGMYDGFFGPGTGSFFIFLFVRLLGYDFLHASASAKVLNVATNFAALALFATRGHVWWQIGLAMAAANIAGSLVGTRLALRHGTGFVRVVFVLVVTALIVKTGVDALRPALP